MEREVLGLSWPQGAGGSCWGRFCGAGPVSGASSPDCRGQRGEGRRRERTKVWRRADSQGRDKENRRPLIRELSNSRSRWLDAYRNVETPRGAGRREKGKCQGRERSRGKEISGGMLLKQQAGEGSSASACTGWGSALPMDRAGFDSGVSSLGVFGGARGQAGCAGFVLGSRTRNFRGCFSIQCRWS